MRALALLPLAVLALACGLIWSAYVATFQSGVLHGFGPMKTPPISMLMFAGPGRAMGQLGFPVVSLLNFVCAKALFHGLEQLAVHTRMLKFTSTLAFVSLAVVGAIPLQADMLLVMKGLAKLNMSSGIHQGAAAIFFLMSIVHMVCWLRIVSTMPRGSPLHFWSSCTQHAEQSHFGRGTRNFSRPLFATHDLREHQEYDRGF